MLEYSNYCAAVNINTQKEQWIWFHTSIAMWKILCHAFLSQIWMVKQMQCQVRSTATVESMIWSSYQTALTERSIETNEPQYIAYRYDLATTTSFYKQTKTFQQTWYRIS